MHPWLDDGKIFPILAHGEAHVKSPHDMIMAIFLLLCKYLFDPKRRPDAHCFAHARYAL